MLRHEVKEVTCDLGFSYKEDPLAPRQFRYGVFACEDLRMPKLGMGSYQRTGDVINLIKLHITWVVNESNEIYNETISDNVLGVHFYYEKGATPGHILATNPQDDGEKFFHGLINIALFRGISRDGGFYGSAVSDEINISIRRFFHKLAPIMYMIAPGRALDLYTRGAPYYGDGEPLLGYKMPRTDDPFGPPPERFRQYPSFISSTVAPLYGDVGGPGGRFQGCNPDRDACDRSYTIIGSRAAYDDPELDYPGNPDHDSNWWARNPNHDLIIDLGAENISQVKGLSRTDNPAELLLGNHTAPNNVRNRPTPNGVGTGHDRPQATRGITMNEIGASPAISLDPGLFYSNSAQGSAGIQGDLKWQLEQRGHQTRARNICLNMEADGTNFRATKFNGQETAGSFTIDLQNLPVKFNDQDEVVWGKVWCIGVNMTPDKVFSRGTMPGLLMTCRLEFTDEPVRKRR